ncbi:unnamed protein product [Musa acuminata subsp. malaccensis]|uniref:(wild Malaysian banana) hypothetical protein n=1 Tax=Musa acuminata subsp. malaccensis TaxID=214687 RepID=A0A804L710_MUSAM|nr:PREDICTED: uncharacterized protein LOC103971460 [Musa acuminata subsp. malaccensis]CAG1864354.1 unnamed protein product [Musa acuminata subsp. malaccensis]
MDLCRYPLDLILVPLSLLLTAGYHTYIWFGSKAKQPATTIGYTMSKRETWLQGVIQDNKKKDMLGVQSLRNALMSAILSASIAVTISTSLAALANNAYNSSHLRRHEFFGSQEGSTVVLKYASALLFLLFSFLSNSLAIGCLIDANFLINAGEEEFHKQAQKMLKRGCVLAVVGNRVLLVTLPMLLWFFGPVPMALSSVAMVLVFYELDLGDMGWKGAPFWSRRLKSVSKSLI